MKITLWIAALLIAGQGLLIGTKRAAGNSYAGNLQAVPQSVLEQNINSFSLTISYTGPQDKPFYAMSLSVNPLSPVMHGPGQAFGLAAQITLEEARKLIEVLAKNGDLQPPPGRRPRGGFIPARTPSTAGAAPPPAADNGAGAANGQPEPTPTGYHIAVHESSPAGPIDYGAPIGFDLRTIDQLDALRQCLMGDAAKDMDQLLDRLSGLRKQWTQEGRVFDSNGLAVFIKPPAAAFAAGAPVSFDVILENDSLAPFALSPDPHNIDCWDLSVQGDQGQPPTRYTVIRKGRRGMADAGTPLVIDTHQKIDIKLSLADCQYYVAPTKFPAKIVAVDSLPPGKYLMNFGIMFNRANEQPIAFGGPLLPAAWSGQVATAPVGFEVAK